MHKDVILAIDAGTSGTRAALVSGDGHVSGQQYLSLQVDTPPVSYTHLTLPTSDLV